MSDDTILTDEQREALESMCGYDDPELARIADTLLQSFKEETN